MNHHLKRLIPFAILVVLSIVVYLTNLHQELSLEKIQEHHDRLLTYVQSHPISSPLIFIAIYTLSVCLIIPDSTILSLLGGLIFPLPLAITYIIFSEVVGGTIFFAIVQVAFSGVGRKKESTFLKNMRHRFNQHQISYLLFLRFSHIIPFWLISGLAADFSVTYQTFIWTCLVGVIPLSAILATAGHSLHALFHQNQIVSVSDIFTTEMKIALFVLGLLALLPIVYQHFRERKKRK